MVRGSVRRARAALADRLVVEYRTGNPDAIAALLGARSLTEMLEQRSTMQRASRQTSKVIGDLVGARRELARRERKLESDRRQADQLVAQAAAAQREVEQGIASQQALVQGLEGEIAQLQREEAARQKRIAAEARARLAAQRAAQRATAAADPGLGGSRGGGGGGGTPIAPPANGSIGARAVAAAMRWLGTPTPGVAATPVAPPAASGAARTPSGSTARA